MSSPDTLTVTCGPAAGGWTTCPTRTCRPGSACSTRRRPRASAAWSSAPTATCRSTSRVGAALDARGLRIVAGTIFDELVSPANRESLLPQTDEICTFITALPRPRDHEGQRFPAPYLTVMDWGHDERDYAAGHSDRAPRLDADAWAGMVANIRAIAELARDRHKVRAVIHPHAGGYIEFEDELDRIAADVPPDLAGLCLDTGHMDYSGMDPIATLRALRRPHRLHPLQRHRRRDLRRRHEPSHPFLRSLRRGRHVPDRSWAHRLRGLHALLGRDRLRRLHHHRAGTRPRNAGGVLADLTASRDFLRGARLPTRSGRMKTWTSSRSAGRRSISTATRSAGGWKTWDLLEIHRRLANEHRLRHRPARPEVALSSPASAMSTWAASLSSSSPAKASTPAG